MVSCSSVVYCVLTIAITCKDNGIKIHEATLFRLVVVLSRPTLAHSSKHMNREHTELNRDANGATVFGKS